MKYRDLLLVKSLLLALVLAIMGGVSPALAQSVTGGLQGTVTDEQKAVLAGVEVRLKNEATGTEASTTTNENGIYRFPALQPGVYSVTVNAEGFKTAEVTQVGVKLGVEVSLDVLMQVGVKGEIVEIVGGEVTIERESSQISANYDTRKVAELPNSVAGGGIDTIALLTPGVVAPDDASFSNSNGTNISSNGGRGRSNNFTIDGQDNNDISVAGPAVNINNTDAVQEFQIVTNNFSAEYGQSSGAIVNLITKGGTNDLHGTVSYFYRNRKLFDTLTTLERRSNKGEADPLLNNTFGFSLGGPIKKDKLFFFYSYQGVREASSVFVQSGPGAQTPTPNGIRALQSISTPAIANVLALAAPFNQPIGNPTVQLDNNGRPITRIVTISNVAVEFAAIQRNVPSPFEENFSTLRFDYQINEKNRFTGRYLYQKQESGNATGSFTNGFLVDVPARSQQFGVTLVSQLSPRIVNEFRFNYSRLRVNFGGNQIGNVPKADSAENAIASIGQPAGFIGFGIANNLPQGRLNDNFQFLNNFSITLGRHSIKAGVDIKRRLTDSNFLPNQNGSFTFSTFTRFVQNNPNNARIAFGEKVLNFTETDQFYYFQDDIRVRDNITLNVGIRYENTGQPYNVLNELTTRRESDPNTAFFNPALPLEARVVPKVDTDSNNFAPRFGFAYSPRFAKAIFGDNKTVFRGGYGISYDLAFYNILINSASASPAVLATTIVGVQGLLPLDPTGPGVRAALMPRAPLRQLDPRTLVRTDVANDFHSPYTQQFSFGMQRQIGNNTIAEARYVGTHSVGQFQSVNGNPDFRALARDFPNLVPAGVRPSQVNGRLIEGQGLLRTRINGASSIYHALQTSLNTRFANQLTLGLSYTFSKQIDNASEIFGSFGGGSTIAFSQNPFDTTGAERGLGAYDVRNNFAMNFIYDLPLFRDQKGVVGKVLGGFQFNGTYFARPGQRYTPVQFAFTSPFTDQAFNSTFSGTLETLRPFLGNPNASVLLVAIDDVTADLFFGTGPSPTGYFTLNSLQSATSSGPVAVSPNDVRFIINTEETARRFGNPFGDVGRNTVKGDNLSRGNFGIFKNTKFGERLNLQFRAEFFNVFNHPNKGVPDPFIDDAGTTFADVNENSGGRRTIQFGLKLIF
jgi:outer membrane receptor protein involved in Fe transport